MLGALATSRVTAVLTPHERGIDVAVEPFEEGEGLRILNAAELPEVGSVIHGLSDRVCIDADRGGGRSICASPSERVIRGSAHMRERR